MNAWRDRFSYALAVLPCPTSGQPVVPADRLLYVPCLDKPAACRTTRCLQLVEVFDWPSEYGFVALNDDGLITEPIELYFYR